MHAACLGRHAADLPGDNDPLDVVELSEQPMEMGQIAEIKVLGCFALIDEGETDWKVRLNTNTSFDIFQCGAPPDLEPPCADFSLHQCCCCCQNDDCADSGP